MLARISNGLYTIDQSGVIRNKNGNVLNAKNQKGYLVISYLENGKKVTVLQHRVVYAFFHGLGCLDKYLTINHKDGDKLNNSIDNLELISVEGNTKHAHDNGLLRRGNRSDNTSGYRGVSYDKQRRKWTANIHKDGIPLRLGRYKTLYDAVQAYNAASQDLYGAGAYLNPLPLQKEDEK